MLSRKAPATEHVVITIAQAKQKADALAGLERWKQRHPEVAARLAAEDVLVDAGRGRVTAWYRVRINLKNVPAELLPLVRQINALIARLAASPEGGIVELGGGVRAICEARRGSDRLSTTMMSTW